MKRGQESIGGPESVKKARQFGPSNSEFQQQQQASYYQPAQLNSSAPSSSAGGMFGSGSSLNGSIAAPPMLNGIGMNMSGGMGMNGMGMGGAMGMNGMGMGMSPMGGAYSAGSLSSSPAIGANNTGASGMTIPASPNSAGLFAQQTGTPSPSQQQQQMYQQQQQQYLQQAQAHAQQQQQQQQQIQPPQTPQQQMAMLGQGMGMVPNMFGGMPMNMQFAFPMGNAFPQTPIMGGQMQNPVQAAAAAAAGNATGRTVYIGNLPSDASVDELLNLVHFGPIESVRVLPERSCVFISFLDGATAASFHADATLKKLGLHGNELKIGWGKASPVPSQVLLSISQSNASRNVYLGGLDENITEEMLRDDLSRFGLIDQVKIVRDKNIGFVHFLSISTATKVVATLPTEPAWAGKRVNYGKDRCAYVPKTQQPGTSAAQHAQAVVQQAGLSPLGMSFSPFTPLTSTFGASLGPGYDANGAANAMLAAAAGSQMNRTVYLGNIHAETTVEELCNVIRGGALQSIRYLPDKHIAFVTFVEPTAAFVFHGNASSTGLTLNNRRLKVGWGKHSGPLSPPLALSIQAGATRNVYVGNIEDFEKFNVEKLKKDFGEYGEIELVNFLKEKNCAFVNFTNISNAIKAIEGIKSKPEYTNLRIAHGKDRCANAPRPPTANGGQQRKPTSPMPPPITTEEVANSADEHPEEVAEETPAAPTVEPTES